MNDDGALVESLKSIASEYWRPNSPVYLSNIPRILQKSLPEFRQILGDRSLKSFAKASEADGGYYVLEHPIQKSRVVLVPKDKEFEFPADAPSPATASPESAGGEIPKTRAATLAFLACIAQLPEKEASQIAIPTWLVAKLLQK